ncbi:hypothetical protein ACE6H2_000899 [Prunus campanulata]
MPILNRRKLRLVRSMEPVWNQPKTLRCQKSVGDTDCRQDGTVAAVGSFETIPSVADADCSRPWVLG